jgi:hypothetical protein
VIRKFKALLAGFFFRLHVISHLTHLPRWSIASFYYAIIIGYNELAKMQTELGQRVICRTMRKLAIDAAASLGLIEPNWLPGNEIVLTIATGNAMPNLEFRESDIALMRIYLAELDAKGGTP